MISVITKHMDKYSLYLNCIDNVGTNLDISIIGPSSTILVHVHRSIILDNCRSLWKLREDDSAVFDLEYKLPGMMAICLASFYGKNAMQNAIANPTYNPSGKWGWHDILDMAECRKFLFLEIDYDAFKTLQVPADGFPHLIEILNMLDMVENPDLVNVLRRNFPCSSYREFHSLEGYDPAIQRYLRNYQLFSYVYCQSKGRNHLKICENASSSACTELSTTSTYTMSSINAVALQTDGELRVVNPYTCKVLFAVLHSDKINQMAFSADCTKLAIVDESCTITVWNLMENCLEATYRIQNQYHGASLNIAFYSETSIAFNENKSVRLWDFRVKYASTLYTNDAYVTSFALSPCCKYIFVHLQQESGLIITTYSRKAVLVNLEKGKSIQLHDEYLDRHVFYGEYILYIHRHPYRHIYWYHAMRLRGFSKVKFVENQFDSKYFTYMENYGKVNMSVGHVKHTITVYYYDGRTPRTYNFMKDMTTSL